MKRDVVSEIDLYHHGVLEAHAGTGKTYTIVGLVVRLLAERRLAIRDILLVTYTQKAAGELLGRIRKGLEAASQTHPDSTVREHLRESLANVHEAMVGTIHGVCLRLLQSFPFESGLPFATELVDDAQGIEVCLREALRADDWKGVFADPSVFREVNEAQSLDKLLATAVSLGVGLLDRSARIYPEGLEHLEEAPDNSSLAGIFAARWACEGSRRWSRKKESQGLLSYQDMLDRMDQALERSDFLEAMRRQAKVGIVDEFQDTSSRQWSLFEKWFLGPGENAGNLYLVGDPKQSIYSFQGADVRTYQRACEALMARVGSRRYTLDQNWRSLATLIGGTNQLVQEATPEGWFLDLSIRYDGANQARAPHRESKPEQILSDDLAKAPVRIVKLVGTAAQARDEYARHCAEWILSLKGRTVDLPEGNSWQPRVLDWNDFAIVVSTRSSAKAFYRVLDEQKIPWAFYKQQGVFSSRAALECAAVLRALHAPASDVGAKTLAMATRLLQGDEVILDQLRELSLSRRWARMIRCLENISGAAGRLLGSPNGDRQWMDLRQVLDYSLEFLLAGTGGLSELIEHLDRLKDDRDQASEDRNLLASATDRGRVQILTMHVSKGLEFPVVFLAAGGRSHQQSVKSWIDEDSNSSLCLMPSLLDKGKEKGSWQTSIDAGEKKAKARVRQEERRLFYVALTRPKLLLVVPCHVKPNALNVEKPQGPLAEAVFPHLNAPGEGIDLLGAPPDRLPLKPLETPPGSAQEKIHSLDELVAVGLPSRVRVQTSYTQVAKTSSASHGLEGRFRRSEEEDLESKDLPEIVADAWLPRGSKTGDALHEILESWMSPQEDLGWMGEDSVSPQRLSAVARILGLHGLDRGLAERVADLLRTVLRSVITLPNGIQLRLCDLAPDDRRPETEFHWAFGPDGMPASKGSAVKGWMVGYIDLLFRVDKIWYVLDWKTTSLDRWNPEALSSSVLEHAYDLQAKLYGRTVASALPCGETFGGAVVLYLRAFADPTTSASGAWVAGPSQDTEEIARRLRAWLHERGQHAGAQP